MVTIVMSDEQAEMVVYWADAWLTDFEEATHQVEQDRSHPDPETMLESVEEMHKNFAQVTDLRDRLTRTKALHV